MRKYWSKLGALAAALLLPAMAHAQGVVQQAGAVVPFRPAAWGSNGVIMDGGSTTAPALSQLALFNGANCPMSVSSQTGPGVATSPFSQFIVCQTLTATTLTFLGLNGASNPAVYFNIGGVSYPFPGPGNGNVSGPGSAVNGDIVCFNTTSGTLIKDCSVGFPIPTASGGTGATTAAGGLNNLSGLPHVASNAALTALAHTVYPVVVRDGYTAAGDAPPLAYVASGTACTFNAGAGDNGAQVAASDGGCWIANFAGPPDAREWGVTYPFTMHVNSSTTGNTDTNNWCFAMSVPCSTFQHATQQAQKMNFANASNTVSLEGGASYAGAKITGALNNNGGSGISGQYLTVTGNSTATVNAATGQGFNISVSDGASVVIANLTLAVASGNVGLFVQNPGAVAEVGTGLVCTGSSASVCLYAEHLGLIEFSTGETLKIQGTFSAAIQANSLAAVEFDPGTFTFDCGSGLTTTSGLLFATYNGHIDWGPTTVNNCTAGSGAIGDPIRAYQGGRVNITNNPIGTNVPGDGEIRLYDPQSSVAYSDGTPVWVPTVSCSSNCALQTGATNYDGNIAFTGAAASVTLTFGKPSNAAAYFSATPSCTLSSNISGAALSLSSWSNTGFIASYGTNFANTNVVSYHCAAPNGG